MTREEFDSCREALGIREADINQRLIENIFFKNSPRAARRPLQRGAGARLRGMRPGRARRAAHPRPASLASCIA